MFAGIGCVSYVSTGESTLSETGNSSISSFSAVYRENIFRNFHQEFLFVFFFFIFCAETRRVDIVRSCRRSIHFHQRNAVLILFAFDCWLALMPLRSR